MHPRQPLPQLSTPTLAHLLGVEVSADWATAFCFSGVLATRTSNLGPTALEKATDLGMSDAYILTLHAMMSG